MGLTWIDLLLLGHAAVSAFMAGLIWTVHAVHYPLFASVGEDFARYAAEHRRRMGRLVALPWAAETGAAALLVVVTPSGVPGWMPVAGLALTCVLIASTVLWQLPAHGVLGRGFDLTAHRRLLRTDRVRVVAWSARAVLALAMLAAALGR